MPRSSCSPSEEAARLLDEETEFPDKFEGDFGTNVVSVLPSFQRILKYCSKIPSGYSKNSIFDFIRCTLYAFVPTFLRKSTATSSKTSAYTHLDGLRGVAALFVFFFHSSYTIWDVRPGYLSRPEYTSLLRLPFIRLLYAGDAMVSIFFVISGFVLSVKPIKLMHAGEHEELFSAIASAGFRRGIRLFAPCFVSTFIVMLVIRLGLFEHTRPLAENRTMLPGSVEFHMFRLDSFTSQLWSWCQQSYNFVHVWDWTNIYAGNTGYDIHLWTIPDEYRCSMLLFLTQVIVARASPRTRIATLLILVAFASSWGRWEMICFWSGAVLAELDVISASSLSIFSASEIRNEENNKTKHTSSTVVWLSVFVVGLYLLSFPDQHPDSTFGYETLFHFVPASFGQKNRFWQAIGAFVVTLSINKLAILQRIFTCSLIRYLGRISFALYLMHGLVIHTVGYTVLPIMWNVTGRQDNFSIGLGWIMSQSVVTTLVIYSADIFWVNIDLPSNRLCHWLESLYFRKKR